MPQGRRKAPFSGKAKKEQLQSKKQRKIASKPFGKARNLMMMAEGDGETCQVQHVNKQPFRGGKSDPNRYVLQFARETDEEIKRRKETAMIKLESVCEKEFEIEIDKFFPPALSFPTRPPWDSTMSKDVLLMKENQYFRKYLQDLETNENCTDLSYFELNLETWRQLWRVLEMADIVLVIVDIRFPALMFPPSLYDYVCNKLEKSIILVLNKVDLAPAPLVVAWTHYLKKKYPDLHIIKFTSFPTYNMRGNTENSKGLKIRRKRGKQKMAAEGAQKLLDACKEIVKDEVDLTSWQNKINEEMNTEYDEVDIEETVELSHQDTSFENHIRLKNGILTIGCVGQPNVGKSSLLNAVMGKKVVSVSRTPGHTKHFQTIFLTKNVRLCDCPGLVFPSKVPKQLQVLMGSYPIAQLREPFSTIVYLAQRVDLVKLLSIQHPEKDEEWSAMDICEGWALKKGFFTARAARPDVHRAANLLLRMALEGKISLCLAPPDYFKLKDTWATHPELEEVKWIQALNKNLEVKLEEENESDSENSEGEACGDAAESSNPEDEDRSDSDDDGDGDGLGAVGSNKFQALEISD